MVAHLQNLVCRAKQQYLQVGVFDFQNNGWMWKKLGFPFNSINDKFGENTKKMDGREGFVE